jgi:hypothetical protein
MKNDNESYFMAFFFFLKNGRGRKKHPWNLKTGVF